MTFFCVVNYFLPSKKAKDVWLKNDAEALLTKQNKNLNRIILKIGCRNNFFSTVKVRFTFSLWTCVIFISFDLSEPLWPFFQSVPLTLLVAGGMQPNRMIYIRGVPHPGAKRSVLGVELSVLRVKEVCFRGGKGLF